MNITELFYKIIEKHKEQGIQLYGSSSIQDIRTFTTKVGFSLPNEFVELYMLSNGFECDEDIFRIVPLEEILMLKDYSKTTFGFAEYLTRCDIWKVSFYQDKSYLIKDTRGAELSSLNEFLSVFLKGNIFEDGGLYDEKYLRKQKTDKPFQTCLFSISTLAYYHIITLLSSHHQSIKHIHQQRF
jgi:hypothetical protein